MTKYVHRDRFDVVGRDERAMTNERVRARGLREAERGARRRAVLDQRRELAEAVVARLARGLHDMNDVIANAVVDVDLADDATRQSEEHTSELQSQSNLVCRLLLEKKKKKKNLKYSK